MEEMTILKLRISNLMRVSAVEIKPDGSLVIVSGRNAQGKTSVLDAILLALGGGKHIPERPIQDGKSKADIHLDLGEYTVDRGFTAKGSSLTVKAKDGSLITSPQKLLDRLVGDLSFDPLEFARMKPAARREVLSSLVKLDVDLDALARERAAAYEVRTGNNKSAQDSRGQLAGLPDRPASYLREEVSVSALLAEIEEVDKRAQSYNQKKEKIHELEAQRDQISDTINELRAKIETLEVTKGELTDIVVNTHSELDFIPPIYSTDPLREQMVAAEATNMEIRARQTLDAKYAELNATVREYTEASIKMTNKIVDCDRRKAKALEQAVFPIEGLSFSDEDVVFNGLPFSQASSAEQLKVSMSIAMALNPKLRVIRITDGSLLDSESMAAIEQLAILHGFQVWCEVVDETGILGFVIEDGMLAERGE